MEDLIESIQETPRPKKTFQALTKLLAGTVNNDSIIKNKTWLNEIPVPGHALLLSLKFRKDEGIWIYSENDTAALQEANELIECILLSMDDDAEDEPMKSARGDNANTNTTGGGSASSSGANGGTGTANNDLDVSMSHNEEDEELIAALAMSMGEGDGQVHKKQKTTTGERNGEDDADDDPMGLKDRQDVEFVRFTDENIVIDPKQVDEVNAIQAQLGEPYIDYQFVASDKILYADPEDGKTWECFNCHKRNPLPPLFKKPATQQEAISLQAKLDSILCGHCRAKPTNVSVTKFHFRPSAWLRPCSSSSDPITDMLYPTITDNSLKSRLCAGFLRDEHGNTLGQPWKVIREEARAEDVVQGAIGNCWFAGALSVVALKPYLVEKLFFNKKDHNKHGAYLVQLCFAGQWRGILLDDLFPCSKVWDGKIDGGSIYFAQGGELSYLQSRRRQLWVPLIEKAAAKLFGCYSALNSGTFGEALGLLTGYPVETMRLYEPKSVKEARAKRRTQIQQLKMAALFRGEQPPEDDQDEVDALDDNLQNDVMWTRLLSYYEAGYIMGLACSHEAVEKSREEVVLQGLQSPHAYGVLEVRELNHDNQTFRLIKIRNPWGERAPQTWKGDFGSEWMDKQPFQLKFELGIVNTSNVKMHDDMSIFWMKFEDLRKYFGQVEVCRVHPSYWLRTDERVWLTSSAGGPGEVIEFDLYQTTEIDLSIWQERHVKREASINAKSTNQDIGFVVFRKMKDTKADGSFHEILQFVQRAKRTRQDQTSIYTTLEGGYTYLVVPLSFSLLREENAFPRQGNVVIHCNHKISGPKLRKQKSSWELINQAIWAILEDDNSGGIGESNAKKTALTCQMTQMQYKDFQTIFIRDGDAGYIMAMENNSDDKACGVQYDMTESLGMCGSRVSAVTFDVIPPKQKLIINVGTQSSRADVIDYSLGMQYVDPEMAIAMQTMLEDFHILTDLTAFSGGKKTDKSLPPEENLLKQAEPEGFFNGHLVRSKSQQEKLAAMEGGEHGGAPGGGGAPTTLTSSGAGASSTTNSSAGAGGNIQPSVSAPSQTGAAGSIAKASNKDSMDEEALLYPQETKTHPHPICHANRTASLVFVMQKMDGYNLFLSQDMLLEEAMKMSVDPKVQLQTRIKQLFNEFSTGENALPPNQAAAKAMQQAQQEMKERGG
ncbi:unnamed protein product [Amoebophrya sp. A120]|nr:unnamed protein product [Amoebophrya sp. A120]|eukprot:GSA120T00013143001.1